MHVLFVGNERSWANQTHVTAKNIVELGDFIKTRSSKKAADLRHVLLRTGKTRGGKDGRILVHGANLIADKGRAVSSDAYLLEYDGALGVQLHGDGGDEVDGGQEKDDEQGQKNIEKTFETVSVHGVYRSILCR